MLVSSPRRVPKPFAKVSGVADEPVPARPGALCPQGRGRAQRLARAVAFSSVCVPSVILLCQRCLVTPAQREGGDAARGAAVGEPHGGRSAVLFSGCLGGAAGRAGPWGYAAPRVRPLRPLGVPEPRTCSAVPGVWAAALPHPCGRRGHGRQPLCLADTADEAVVHELPWTSSSRWRASLCPSGGSHPGTCVGRPPGHPSHSVTSPVGPSSLGRLLDCGEK